jgi:hypothetical protein
MKQQINLEEIGTLIAKEIREKGLNDAINLNTVKERVMKKIQEMQGAPKEINEMENTVVANGPVKFPNPAEDEEKFKIAPDIKQPEVETPKVGLEAGAQPLETPIEPKTAIIPETPDFLKDVEPGKIFVFDFNELSVGGENLSNKPFKTIENPEISKSMAQMWSENGITKAEVYQTKFEKIGEVVFDYKGGSSQFIQKGAEPDFDVQQQYKQNPYAGEPNKEIENYVKNNVDIDKKINDVITNIVKSYFLTNSERATNDKQQFGTENILPAQPSAEQNAINKPIQEGKITVRDLVDNFQKIDTPDDLLETIEGKKKTAKLIYEDKEVKKWLLNDKEYYFPSDPMSIRKCYVK